MNLIEKSNLVEKVEFNRLFRTFLSKKDNIYDLFRSILKFLMEYGQILIKIVATSKNPIKFESKIQLQYDSNSIKTNSNTQVD